MGKHRSSVVPSHVTLNIEAVASLRASSESELPNSQRPIESLTVALGRPRTLMVLIGGIAIWAFYNGGGAAIAGMHPFDPPPFYWLQGLVGLYAALMTTMILTTQNRQNREAEKRAHLELQVSLLAEQRTAKIVALLEELRRDLPSVKDRPDPVAEAMQETVPPSAVIFALEQNLAGADAVKKNHGK